MATLRKLIDGIGRAELCKLVGVTSQTISNHLRSGRLPGEYYLAMRNLADDAGLDCPWRFFKWVGDVQYPPETFQGETLARMDVGYSGDWHCAVSRLAENASLEVSDSTFNWGSGSAFPPSADRPNGQEGEG